MRLPAIVLLALLSAASAAPAQTLRDMLEQLKRTWNEPTEPFRVVGNVYYVGTAGLSSFLITSSEGHVLIDTGLPEANPQIKANIAKLGFKVGDIKQLLNTHAHVDHAGGLAELKQETNASLAASAADKPLLEGGYYPGQESDTALAFPPVLVDREVGDGDRIKVGDVILTALMTPGHSPGCTTWTMTATENGRDYRVVFFCSATVALNRLVGTPTYRGIVEDYRKTFARVRNIKADVFLAPHPEMFRMHEKRAQIREGGPNPFVQDGELNAYAATLEREFETELAKQTAALKKD